MKVNSWAGVSTGTISKQAILDLHSIEDGFRHFPDSFDAGVKFPGTIARPIRVYVLSGTCSYVLGNLQIWISGGEYVDLLPGEYEFEVGVVAPVTLVRVFKMPDLKNFNGAG